jgi:hypothetical protein
MYMYVQKWKKRAYSEGCYVRTRMYMRACMYVCIVCIHIHMYIYIHTTSFRKKRAYSGDRYVRTCTDYLRVWSCCETSGRIQIYLRCFCRSFSYLFRLVRKASWYGTCGSRRTKLFFNLKEIYARLTRSLRCVHVCMCIHVYILYMYKCIPFVFSNSWRIVPDRWGLCIHKVCVRMYAWNACVWFYLKEMYGQLARCVRCVCVCKYSQYIHACMVCMYVFQLEDDILAT